MKNKEKDQFQLYMQSIKGIVPEHKFHPTRKWRFDFALPARKIAFEYEGIFAGKSRHTTLSGYTKDCEKYNEAGLHGWTVLRFTAIMIKSGDAWDMVGRAIK